MAGFLCVDNTNGEGFTNVGAVSNPRVETPCMALLWIIAILINAWNNAVQEWFSRQTAGQLDRELVFALTPDVTVGATNISPLTGLKKLKSVCKIF